MTIDIPMRPYTPRPADPDMVARVRASGAAGNLPLSDLSAAGMLFHINNLAFHPLGFALTLAQNDEGEITGWSLQGDGTTPFSFDRATVEKHMNTSLAILMPPGE